MRLRPRPCARVAAGAAVGTVVWQVVSDGWRSVEAAIVAGVAAIGPGSVEWAGGDQIWVNGAGAPFVVVIGPWCTSAGPTLAAFAVCAAHGRTKAAIRAAVLAATLLFVGNLVRMVAVVAVGARSGAADLEVAHDGWATWWAVAVVLGSIAIVAATFRPMRAPVAPSPSVARPVATSS